MQPLRWLGLSLSLFMTAGCSSSIEGPSTALLATGSGDFICFWKTDYDRLHVFPAKITSSDPAADKFKAETIGDSFDYFATDICLVRQNGKYFVGHITSSLCVSGRGTDTFEFYQAQELASTDATGRTPPAISPEQITNNQHQGYPTFPDLKTKGTQLAQVAKSLKSQREFGVIADPAALPELSTRVFGGDWTPLAKWRFRHTLADGRTLYRFQSIEGHLQPVTELGSLGNGSNETSTVPGTITVWHKTSGPRLKATTVIAK